MSISLSLNIYVYTVIWYIIGFPYYSSLVSVPSEKPRLSAPEDCPRPGGILARATKGEQGDVFGGGWRSLARRTRSVAQEAETLGVLGLYVLVPVRQKFRRGAELPEGRARHTHDVCA